MREESGSEEDCDEPVEWEDDDEVASEEDGSEEEVRVSNAQRGKGEFPEAALADANLLATTDAPCETGSFSAYRNDGKGNCSVATYILGNFGIIACVFGAV